MPATGFKLEFKRNYNFTENEIEHHFVHLGDVEENSLGIRRSRII
jgi:hypothetical protein